MAFIHFTFLSLIGTLLITTMPATTQELKDLEALIPGSNKFAIELYQASKKSGENLVISPVSAKSVLDLVYAGSAGETKKQLQNTLHLPDDEDVVLRGNKQLIESLQAPVLQTTNKIYADKTTHILPSYQEVAEKYFLSKVGEVDFVNAAESARQEINTFVEDHTNKKIKDLLPVRSVDESTRLVLLNAIYFKANWQTKFNPNRTEKNADFYTAPNTKTKVDMMRIKKKFNFREHAALDAKILELPYEDKDFKMVVILPNKIDGLEEVETKLKNVNLADELSSGLYEVMVDVSMPKFKIESTIELNDILIKLGIKDLFDSGRANLTRMSTEPLFASRAIQKAFIEVNEEGTEAAAATAVVITFLSAPVGPRRFESFTVDHPFLYIIKKRDVIMFVGRIAKL